MHQLALTGPVRGGIVLFQHYQPIAIHNGIARLNFFQCDEASAKRVHVQLPSGVGSADVELTLTEELGRIWRVTAHVRRAATITTECPAVRRAWAELRTCVATPPLRPRMGVTRAIRTAAPQFSALRMVKQYVEEMYAPAAEQAKGSGVC